MALVDYSDSDDSGAEDAPPVKAAANTTKPAVSKIVDRSNPGKIRVSLPQPSSKDEASHEEPPAKRVKTGGGLFGGLASFLPPPKQTGAIGKGAMGSTTRRGLGAGVNLKTGAGPGFSREPEEGFGNGSSTAPVENEDRGKSQDNGIQLPPPKTADSATKSEEVKLVGKPLMFKPLSVARKPTKKKKQQTPGNDSTTVKTTAATQARTQEPPIQPTDSQPEKRAKVSLFSLDVESSSASSMPTRGQYESIIYEPHKQQSDIGESLADVAYSNSAAVSNSIPPPSTDPTPSAQSLDSIASDLNLSAADRRQLFGRQKPGSRNNTSFQATKIINFNTDKEYAHNEELRASGEEVVHNPVRAIAPGKHSLKQLVNAAQNQKEALEESFAKGKSNRAEASSKYGW